MPVFDPVFVRNHKKTNVFAAVYLLILWLDPKAQKKSILTSGSIPYFRFGVSCKEQVYHLLAPKGGAKSVRRAPPSGSDKGGH